jgi:hypothetical protein
MKLSVELIQDLVARLVEAVHPTRILLFGSAAWDEIGLPRDVDLLMAIPDGAFQKEPWIFAHRQLRRFPIVTDLAPLNEGDAISAQIEGMFTR